MSTLIMAGILSGFAGCSALIMKKNFEQQLPLAAGLVIVILYVFSLFGQLTAGAYAVLALAAAALPLVPVWMIAKRNEQPLKYLFTPGTAAFGLLVLWLLIGFRGYMFSEWDDFSHWGVAVKNMYIYSALPSGIPNATISYTDYPPATTLYSWFWCKLSGAFNEEDTQRALNMLMMCFLLPVMKNQRWKKPGKALCMLAMLFALPLMFGTNVYRTLQVDTLMGCMMLYALHEWFLGEQDVSACLGISCVLFLLPLVKEIGLAFAGLMLVILIVDTIFAASKLWKRRAVWTVLFVLAMVAGGLSWKGYLHIHQTAEVWNKSRVSLYTLGQMMLGKAHPDFYAITRSFLNALFDPDLWGTNHVLPFSFVSWMIIVFVGMRWMLLKQTEQDQRLKRMYRIFCGGLAAYVGGLLCSYLFLFRLDEALNMNSLERYLTTALIPYAGFAMILFINKTDDSLQKYGLNAPLCLLACLMVAGNPQLLVQQSVMMKARNTPVYEQRMQQVIPNDVLEQLDSTADRVYYVAVHDWGERYYKAAYQFTPVRIQDGMWSAWPVACKTEIFEDKPAIVYSPEEWKQTLDTNGFTHVYLDEIDERFINDYALLFEDESAILEGALYRITTTETGMVLKNCAILDDEVT